MTTNTKEREELPPLPTSLMHVEVWDSEVQGLHGANAQYFSPEQMRDYALAAIASRRAAPVEAPQTSPTKHDVFAIAVAFDYITPSGNFPTHERFMQFCEAVARCFAAPVESPGVIDEQIKAAFQKYGTGRFDGFAAAVRALLSRSVQTPAQEAVDARRLDWLERKRLAGRENGFQWNSWSFDCLQSEQSIREQIDAALSASAPKEGAGVASHVEAQSKGGNSDE